MNTHHHTLDHLPLQSDGARGDVSGWARGRTLPSLPTGPIRPVRVKLRANTRPMKTHAPQHTPIICCATPDGQSTRRSAPLHKVAESRVQIADKFAALFAGKGWQK